MKTMQYTIRGIPPTVDHAVRERARKSNESLNSILAGAIRRGLGLTEDQPDFHDLDDLAGTWVPDPEFDRAMEMFESIDQDVWQ